MTRKQIDNAVERAAEFLRENPCWTYKQAIEKAKEMVLDEHQRNN